MTRMHSHLLTRMHSHAFLGSRLVGIASELGQVVDMNNRRMNFTLKPNSCLPSKWTIFLGRACSVSTDTVGHLVRNCPCGVPDLRRLQPHPVRANPTFARRRSSWPRTERLGCHRSLNTFGVPTVETRWFGESVPHSSSRGGQLDTPSDSQSQVYQI